LAILDIPKTLIIQLQNIKIIILPQFIRQYFVFDVLDLIQCLCQMFARKMANLIFAVQIFRFMSKSSVLCPNLPFYVQIFRFMSKSSVLCPNLPFYVQIFRFMMISANKILFNFSGLCLFLSVSTSMDVVAMSVSVPVRAYVRDPTRAYLSYSFCLPYYHTQYII